MWFVWVFSKAAKNRQFTSIPLPVDEFAFLFNGAQKKKRYVGLICYGLDRQNKAFGCKRLTFYDLF